MPVDVSAAGEEQKRSVLGSTTATNTGNRTGGGGGGNADDNNADDVTRTSDIFGINDNNDNQPQQGNQSDQNDGNAGQNAGGDNDAGDGDSPNPLDTGGEGDDTGDEDMPGGEEGGEDGETGDEEPEGEFVDHTEISAATKERLRTKMIALYQTIRGNIDLLNDYTAEHDNINTIKDINNIIDNLTESAKVLYKTLTSDVNKMEYADMLKIFIGVQKVYDISITMIDKHFAELKKERDKEDKKSKKLERKPHRILTTFQ